MLELKILKVYKGKNYENFLSGIYRGILLEILPGILLGIVKDLKHLKAL